jgi:hypothetical protein
MSKLVAACTVAVAILGCRSKRETPEPEAYRYQITVHNGDEFVTGDLAFSLNGAPLVVKDHELIVPKGIRLTDPSSRLTVRKTDSCGEHGVPVHNMPAYDKARDEDSARSGARRYDQAIAWKVAFDKPAATRPGAGLYVDNLDRDRPATVRVGAWSIEVPARTGKSAGVELGDCATADEVAIDGRVVGTLGALGAGDMTLVDIDGGHCYMTIEAAYGNAERAGDVASYGGVPGQHLLRVPRVDNLFTANADSTTVHASTVEDARSKSAYRTSLTRMECGRNARRAPTR